MGERVIHYRAFLSGLREGGDPDDGRVASELCSPLGGGGSEEDLDRCALRFVSWMREHGSAEGGAAMPARAAGGPGPPSGARAHSLEEVR
jgi:hypothetical protein